ncbi:NAD(P)/FAD-dependent oxidoreductase [Fructilactobacillus sp. Tb1]|uniref:NAD(P)/FAD-dependent oxidoreductase n=1 Tax=Fructilactobacillus sp. Tb1 TaxID=3422304 RepID=UPI003D27ECE7
MTDVLVLGAGYAGMRACKELAKSKVDLNVTLVNKNSYHYDATALHTVAAGTNVPENIEMDIRDSVSKKINFVQDTVLNINREKNEVELEKNGSLHYDYLFNALGFQPETFGTPGADDIALQISNVDNALADYKTILAALEKYKETKDKSLLTIAVVGGGFTSIELLGELAHQVPKWAKKYGFAKDDMKINCVAPSFLPMFSQKYANYAKKYLEKKGINFIMGSTVSEVKETGVIYGDDQTFLPANITFWTAGVRGNQIMEKAGYDQHRDRVAVNADMSLNDFPNEYIIGDVSAVKDPASGRMYPTTGQISIVEATNAVKNLEAKLQGKAPVKFVYNSLGTVCSLGPYSGIADINLLGMHIKLKGIVVPPLKHAIIKRSAFELSGLKAALQS